MTPSEIQQIMVMLAKIEERVIAIQKRLDKGDEAFEDLDDRIRDLEERMTKMMTGFAILAFVLPIVVTVIMNVYF